jgi:hypothetical protein
VWGVGCLTPRAKQAARIAERSEAPGLAYLLLTLLLSFYYQRSLGFTMKSYALLKFYYEVLQLSLCTEVLLRRVRWVSLTPRAKQAARIAECGEAPGLAYLRHSPLIVLLSEVLIFYYALRRLYYEVL